MTCLRELRAGAVVYLPLQAEISGSEVCRSLGISRAVLHTWRRNHGFPISNRTAPVAAWLESVGALVKWES